MRAPRCLDLIALLSLAAPCLAQGAEPTSPWTWLDPAAGPTYEATSAYAPGARAMLDPYATDLRFPAVESTALARASLLAADPAWLGLERSAEALSLGRGPVRRAEVDGAAAVAFDDLPGGVLLGLVAQPDVALTEPRLRAAGMRLELVDGGRVYRLPAADASFLRACLAFAASAHADQAAVDIRSSGAVDLAPELVDTAVGLALIGCDRVPHLRRPDRHLTKSLIVDRAARLAFDAASGELRPEAELEVRFYSQELAQPNALCLEALPVRGALRAELAECERIAAWVAFFRWARAADPEGVARVADTLACADLGLVGMRTPRWVAPTGASIPPRGSRPSEVADWMRVYRERVSAGAR